MKIEEKRQLVASFLEHCIAYSDASILRKKERGNDIKEIDKKKKMHKRNISISCVGNVCSRDTGHW